MLFASSMSVFSRRQYVFFDPSFYVVDQVVQLLGVIVAVGNLP